MSGRARRTIRSSRALRSARGETFFFAVIFFTDGFFLRGSFFLLSPCFFGVGFFYRHRKSTCRETLKQPTSRSRQTILVLYNFLPINLFRLWITKKISAYAEIFDRYCPVLVVRYRRHIPQLYPAGRTWIV